eukprot:TRINITY_DN25011_c0_g1_i1.p1 TRINITY_DN25011_c0_g1~~TRINITY_DN25011_c0_g1_i1.p1  ORF type:complete len:912 (+),score=212.05 TRINITY_DN25011_c0_g1_i1:71-2806(+)
MALFTSVVGQRGMDGAPAQALMLGLGGGPFSWAVRALLAKVAHPEDTPRDTARKRSMLVGQLLFIMLLILSLPSVVRLTFKDDGIKVSLWLAGLGIEAAFFGYILAVKRLPDSVIAATITSTAVCVCFCDIAFSAEMASSRPWPLFVILVDLLLVLQVDRKCSIALVGFVVFWMLLMEAEHIFRFGMLDMPGTIDYNTRRQRCDCDRPPCAETQALKQTGVVFAAIFVFVTDFLLTRAFATSLVEEGNRMGASIRAADVIANLLADFNLEAAKDHLDSNRDEIPAGLMEAFDRILRNLRSYRPFLPPVLFKSIHADHARAAPLVDAPAGLNKGDASYTVAPSSSAAARQSSDFDVQHQLARKPPGWGFDKPTVTIVFVGIDSCALWDEAWEIMPDAVQLYRMTVRKALTAFNGYEAKAIGDDFMVVFNTPHEAMQFSTSLHTLLLDAVWPAELMGQEGCRRDAAMMWGGLAAKVGLHTGPAKLRLDEVTARWNYHGPVNYRAWKLMEACPIGAALASVTVRDAVADDAALLGNVEARVCGRVGCMYVPCNLKGRMDNVSTAAVVDRLGDLTTVPQSTPTFDINGSDLASTTASSGDLMVHNRQDSGSMTSGSAQETLTTTAVSTPTKPLHENGFERVESLSLATVTMRSCPGLNVDPDRAAMLMNKAFAYTLLQIDKTGGTLLALTGSTLSVGWNLHRDCELHIESSFRFVGLLFNRGDLPSDESAAAAAPSFMPPAIPSFGVHASYLPVPAVVGLSSGQGFFGRVGLARQQFFTCIGFPSYINAALAQAAMKIHVKCLYAAEPGMPSASTMLIMRQFTRPVDRWTVTGCKKVNVLEVDVRSLAKTAASRLVATPIRSAVPWAWSEQYRMAFAARDITKIDAASSSDETIDLVCDLLSRKTHILGSDLVCI